MTDEEIKALGSLSRLSFSAGEIEAFRKEIDAILAYVGEISAVSGEEGAALPRPLNVMREDASAHEPGVYTHALLGAAPNREGEYIKVKKILHEGR